jgi:PAS domain S-box-containing protein
MQFAEAILSMRSDAIIAADREGIIHFWNSGAGRLFGYSPDEAISRSLDFIIPERLRQRHWDGYRRVMETGKSRYGESDVLSVPAVRKDGTTISVEFTCRPTTERRQDDRHGCHHARRDKSLQRDARIEAKARRAFE